MKVYYFTSSHFALSNLSLKRLKVSRFGDLNDPFELLAANLEQASSRNAFAAIQRHLNETKGLLCFSRTWSNPLLWGHYADRHTGIALGFEVPDHLLSQVLYSSQRVPFRVDGTSKLKLVARILRTKFADWKYEDEYRLVVPLDVKTKESGLFFHDFSGDLRLVEVVLGPRCEIPVERIRTFLRADLPQVKVLKARMAFRTFRIIEDRRYRRSSSGAHRANHPSDVRVPTHWAKSRGMNRSGA